MKSVFQKLILIKLYIGNPESFIKGLIEEIKHSTSSGGSVKRKKRKTRKNKSSIFNKR
jgi:hypothetical protein